MPGGFSICADGLKRSKSSCTISQNNNAEIAAQPYVRY